MALLQQDSPALDKLSDKEIEVLRLLAAGHTVKSMAMRLGRTEASINERLRDARRKTGFGSSRELARQLAAQKIWDKNIDLHGDTGSPANAEALRQSERLNAKGKIAMLIALPTAAAAIALVVAGANSAQHSATRPAAHAAAAAQAPLVGSWALDTARVPADERPRRVTIRFALTPEGQWNTRVDIVGNDGAALHSESTAALDGVAVPVSGNMAMIDSVSLRQSAPNTLVMTLGKNGAPVSTRVYAVASDGRSMTETIVWPGGTLPRLETNHFNRI